MTAFPLMVHWTDTALVFYLGRPCLMAYRGGRGERLLFLSRF